MDDIKNTEEALENNCGIKSIGERTKSIEEITEIANEIKTMDDIKNTDETLKSNCGKKSTGEKTKSIEEITKSTCKVPITECTDEITESSCGISKSNEMAESTYEPTKNTGEVKDTYQVKRNADEETKEAVMENTDEVIQIPNKVTKSNDNVKNADKVAKISDEVKRAAVMVRRTLGISNEFDQKEELGSGTSNSAENLEKNLNKGRKEDAVEAKIHTTPLVEENLDHADNSEWGKKQMMKENVNILEEAKINSGVGSNKEKGNVIHQGEMLTVLKSRETMETNRTHSQKLEEKQDDSLSRKCNDSGSNDGKGKDDEINSRRSKSKRMDEKGKRKHTSHSTRSNESEDTYPSRKRYNRERDISRKSVRRDSSCSSRDFERVSNSPRHRKRKSSYSAGRKSSSPRFNDKNVSYSRDYETDVAHYSGWHGKESYHYQKHGRPNRHSYEEEENDSKSRSYMGRSCERESSNQRLNERESEHSAYWNEDESNSSWNELRGDEEKDQYMTSDINERKPKIEGTENDTEGIENGSSVNRKVSLSDLVARSGMLINEDIRRKFAKACVSFLNTINPVPSGSQENDWHYKHSEKDAGPQYSQKKSYSQSRSSFISDSDPAQTGFSRYDRTKKRCENLRKENSCELYNMSDADRQHGQDWYCSPEMGYNSDECYTDQNSRHTSMGSSGRHHRKHMSYSTSHSQSLRCENFRNENSCELYNISDADRQHGQDWYCSPEMGYNADECYNDQNSRHMSMGSSGRHHRKHMSYSTSHSQSLRHSSSGTEDDINEDPIGIFRHSSEKIRKQCEKERDPAIRRALLSLFDAHDHECSLYLKQPDAHPDYNKEYRMFVQQKTRSILELGGDPKTFNFHLEWRKYWPSRMNDLFKDNWEMKMQQCTSFLSQKNNCSSSESSTDSSSSSSSASSSQSASSSDDSTNSDTREKVRRYSKRKKMSRYSESKAVSAKGKRKWEEKNWKPLNILEEGTEDLTLELDIKRFREASDSHSIDKCKPNKQASLSLHLHNQNNQGAVQVLDVLKVINHMKERFGELEEPLNTLYLRAVDLKEKNLDSNEILEEEECCSTLEKLGEKLENILEDKSLTVIQKVITREAHERFSHLLLRIRERKSPHMGLDIGSVARITMGKDEGETLTFIKNALLYQGHSCISNEKLISIYLEVKEEHKNIEYASSAQKLMSHKNSIFSAPDVSKDESNLSYVEPSHLYQSQCQQHIQLPPVYTQPFFSSPHPDSHSSINVPLATAPMIPDTIKNSETRTLTPVSLSQSPSFNSRKKESSPVPSTDFTARVKTPPVESEKVSPVSKDHPTGLEQSSLSASSLVKSCPASPVETDPSAPTMEVSELEPVPSTSEAITSGSECELISNSKLYQNTIKDCFISPSSSPREDPPLVSSESCMKFDYMNPEYSFSIPFSNLLEIDPIKSSVNTVNVCDSKPSEHSDESGSNVVTYEEPSTTFSKKPIRITIPQLSKQKGFIPSFNPTTDDQELL